ncbi:hypothetical protein [Streptomyces sp. URMC 123]|uniref:hypothetical protein n=1 Tax=Streptomyces sp. URMC 123 TaxID=3423403 RepID=UPI003F1CFB9F
MQWQQAAERAHDIVTGSRQGFLYPVGSWDGRAIRGVLSVVLAGLAARQRCVVAEVATGSVLWHVAQGPEAVYALGRELGLDTDTGRPEALAREEWAWLTRRWPAAPPLANSDGLPRGIGRGSELPAVDICTLRAFFPVRDALAAERPPGLPPQAQVLVTAGAYEGRAGIVDAPTWLMDDERQTAEPGPPQGYEVLLAAPTPPAAAQGLECRRADAGERVIIPAGDLVAMQE